MTTGNVVIELEGVNKLVHAGSIGARMSHGGQADDRQGCD